MADRETGKSLPYTGFPVMDSHIDRMAEEGIPDKIDKNFLVDMAPGTQFQYRQGYRLSGLTTSDDRPTPLLVELVHANVAGRRQLWEKILLDRWPDLAGLPMDASKDDFFAVLRDRYGVASDIQRRKMLTFFVAAADYAQLEISPNIRPVKGGGALRKQDRAGDAAAPAAEVHEISLGDAGSVSVTVNIARVWDLSEDQFAKLRKLMKEIEALRDSGS